ncbi:hypothetical protein [Melittangium boletus]|uniref:Uncharacterized protein n=1 Tax=Melittangium boletus DSM 14713 TaxID=1294270 RepID=A0A250IPR6_9BACT|nr:hypothetical protein [Melittangium boletus]ATB33232.1 hypothetical protein MEBOL_006721 [Melittangium boletus DSM 14713]
MKPLATRSLVPPRTQKRACTLSVSRAALEERLGEPLVHDEEGDGMGPRYRWESTCECGLELFIEMPVQSAQEPPEASLWMEHVEVDHALAHLGLSPRDVLWRADMQHPLSLDGWAIVHTDARGQRHDQCVLPLRDHAECLSRLMGTRSPNQSYSVEPRGTPSRQGWAVIRQDEHGNQYEVAVHPQRRPMTRLVAS